MHSQKQAAVTDEQEGRFEYSCHLDAFTAEMALEDLYASGRVSPAEKPRIEYNPARQLGRRWIITIAYAY